MPRIYQDILNGLPANILPSLFKQTPGGAILTDPLARDMNGLFQAFCNYFRVLHPWIWDGGSKTPSAGEILDGVKNLGQCAALANAFRALAVRSLPYGLGLSEFHVGKTSDPQQGLYKGRNNAGFVSRHGAGAVLSLASNVWATPNPEGTFTRVTPASVLTDLYLWDNHKTVPYGGQYYDVLYGTIWASKDLMAEYHLVEPSLLRQQINPLTNRAIIVEYLPATGTNGQTCYFRSLTEDEVQHIQRRGYQGPFSTLPGTAWDGPAPGNVSFRKLMFSKT